jgi:peptidyl-prolyl cis-trans isomerase C
LLEFKRVRPLIVLFMLLVASCSVGGNSVSSPTAEPLNVELAAQANPAPPTVQVNEQGISIVARVNGVEITQPELDQALARSQQQAFVSDPAALQASILDTLIEQELILQEATRAQIVVTDEQVEAEFQALKSQAGSEDVWQQWLAENQYTEVEFRATLRPSLLTGILRDQVTQNMPEQVLHVHARHILVESEAQASEILTRLQNGEDFVALAASISKDVTTRDQGGDLGWFADGELLEPRLSQVAFTLEPGQIAGPVATRLGYHVIQTLERAEMPVPPERRPLLAQITFEKWLRGLAYNAIIERYL